VDPGVLKIQRHFTTPGVHPFDQLEWETRTATITNEKGELVFEQRDVEMPTTWSQMATNVVVSKYFKGPLGTPQRERSLKQLIGRVTETLREWGQKDGYFATDEEAETFHAELTYLLVNQMASFNSPVWFNLGVEPRPQASACFINSVEDTMESILELAKTEGMLFKYGSGTGSNLSTIRSSKERLSSGGVASGPVSFMRGYDSFAGVIKCVTGDTLVWTEQGGVPIVEARGKIATGKGFADLSEFHVNDAKPVYGIRLGYTGLELRGTGNHPVLTMTSEGLAWQSLENLAPGDAVAVSRGHWPRIEDAQIDYIPALNEAYRKKDYHLPNRMSPELGLILGLLCAEGSIDAQRVRFTNGDQETIETYVDAWRRVFGYTPEPRRESAKNCWEVSSHCLDIVGFLRALGIDSPASSKRVPGLIFRSSRETAKAFLRGYFEGDGHNGRTVFAVSASKTLRDQVQQLLLALGFVSAAYTTSHGYFGVRLSGEEARRFRREIGFVSARKAGSAPAESSHMNTNIDVLPGLVSAVRRYSLGSGWFDTPSGKKWLSFGFFNRASENVSLQWLREHPEALESLQSLSHALYEAASETLEHGYFWDRVGQTWVDDPEVTYDVTVPGDHRFVGNGIICHNSGGKTRRAAKMVILNMDHPDIEEFINCKAAEEKKAWALIEAGYDGGFNVPGGAYDSVFFQNANHSVRATDEFMRAVIDDKEWSTRAVTTGEVVGRYQARDLMRQIAEAAWLCGDPGMQFDTTTNEWHTCPNSGRINASNPCSEFVFLDDSACNLASLNLLKFLREDGTFDVAAFRQAVHLVLLAQEILVDNASYPTPAIERNSHDFRPLGLGYANLGALLMAQGLPYDSERGRAYAATITALMTGQAYRTSAEIASRKGAFAAFPKNREPMLRVIRRHAEHVDRVDRAKVSPDLWRAAKQVWDEAYTLGERYGYRNAQVTLLAPTGTIGFMMDCDTTGIEPDIALVKYKKLVGGGMLKIVNNTVPQALKRLGYDGQQIAAIVEYIDDHETIEGAPGLREEDLPVFDCAFKSFNGMRSIHYLGHIKMMAAVQPFLSGAISKCVTGDTLILTERGLVPIGQFYENEAPDSFRTCSLGLASDGPLQQADLFYYGGWQETIRLVLADGRTIEGTPNHQVKVANRSGYGWKRLDEITPEDMVAIRLGTDLWATENPPLCFQPSPLYGCPKTMRIPTVMSKALGRFLGYYIAEGNLARSSWTVRITHNSDAVLQRCAALVQELFGLEGRIEVDSRNGVKSFVVASKTLVEFLEYLGCGGQAEEKEIPACILQSRREVVQAFVGGLWLDGYIRHDGMVAIGMKSERLLQQLQVVLNNFGLRPRIIRKYNRDYDRFYPELGLHGHDAQQFAHLFELDEPWKIERLREGLDRRKVTSAVWSDVVPCYRELIEDVVRDHHDTTQWRHIFDARTQHLSWETVKNIQEQYRLPELAEIVDFQIHFVPVREIVEGYAEVYDFHVPGHHAFIGNGVINHNTVNMPHEATVEDILEAYLEAWKRGLKAIAVYRDGCKRTQPVSTRRAEKKEEEERRPVRRRLPDERKSITHKFSIAGHEGYITVGMYEDGSPGEIFITMSKEGSCVSGLMDSFATAISMALQYGVPLRELVQKFSHMRFEPSGWTNNKQIPMAKSIMDYIFRWLAMKFLPEEEQPTAGLMMESDNGNGQVAPSALTSEALQNLQASERLIFEAQADAPPCAECGSIMVRNGTCYKCINCGVTSGCS